ncbi:MAG: NUDIX domain-containing protein [Chloroflexota bacterium]|nr:NUDIX domain-containing protein [Chloroflexota bacterium]MDE2894662.1 NUDIX domain-containing protein [Chloroflexota bacterium]
MPRLRSNIVAVYIVRPALDGVELLMLQRPEGHRFAGAWQTVGGHIEEKQGETAWQAALRELNEETALDVERWFRIDRPETFYNPENDTIYFVPAFAALVATGAEPTISDEHQAWRWQRPDDAAETVDWAAMRDSILMVGEALADPEHPGLGVTEFDPLNIGDLSQ